MKHPSHLLATVMLAASTLVAVSANAGTPPEPWTQASHVTDIVTDNSGSWNYQFTVFNDSTCNIDPGTCYFEIGEPIIIDWELPYYDDMGITNILDPIGWAHTIETIGVANPTTGWTGVAPWQDPSDPSFPLFGDPNGPFGVNNLTQVLHWYVIDTAACNFAPPSLSAGDVVGLPPCPGIATPLTPFGGQFHVGSLGGFGFDASFAPTAAPYSTSWMILDPVSGDPAFPFGVLPASPSVTGATAVPLPSALALLSLGLISLGVGLRRRTV